MSLCKNCGLEKKSEKIWKVILEDSENRAEFLVIANSKSSAQSKVKNHSDYKYYINRRYFDLVGVEFYTNTDDLEPSELDDFKNGIFFHDEERKR